jgi:hypothetical protein
MNLGKFQNDVKCTCNEHVMFDVVEDIECNWGSHTVIQCPKCEELFSTDKKCPAFKSVEALLKNNPLLFSEDEQYDYVSNSHPCC